MRTAWILLFLAAPLLAEDEAPAAKRISYVKKVMVDPDYASSWTQERIRETLERSDWRARMAEHRAALAAPPPPPVYVEVPVARYGGSDYDYGYCPYDYGYRYRYRHYGYGHRYSGRGRHRSTFPLFTFLGGTAGGIIGHQSRETGEGIAIGAGVGLLADAIFSDW